jgi:hypothetical protein
MRNEAALKNIPPEGYEGGLIIDEILSSVWHSI